MTAHVVCQGCGAVMQPDHIGQRYCNVENGLTLLYLCPGCAHRVQTLMSEVLSIVKTPYAYFRNFLPDGARSNLRGDPS